MKVNFTLSLAVMAHCCALAVEEHKHSRQMFLNTGLGTLIFFLLVQASDAEATPCRHRDGVGAGDVGGGGVA